MTTPRPVRRVYTADRQIDDAQRSAQESAQRLNALPSFTGGTLLTENEGSLDIGSGIGFTGGVAKSIRHGLGRKAIGFVEVQAADVSSVRPNLRSTTHPSGVTSATHITVLPGSTGRCFIWVF